MKNFKRHWLLVMVVLMTALLISCQTTFEEPQPGQTPTEVPPTSQTQAEGSSPLETPKSPSDPISSNPAEVDNSDLPITPVEKPQPGQTPTEVPPTSQTQTEEPPPVETPKSLSDLISSNPAEVDNSDLPITPVGELGITGTAPKVSIENYRLTVDGLVETPLTLTYEALLAYPTVSEVLLLICPSFFADNAEWTGVPMTTIMAEAGVKPEASEVTFYAIDGYQETLALEDVQQEGVLLAYAVNGQTLPAEHGYPLRLAVKGKYGAYWVKWLERIEFR